MDEVTPGGTILKISHDYLACPIPFLLFVFMGRLYVGNCVFCLVDEKVPAVTTFKIVRDLPKMVSSCCLELSFFIRSDLLIISLHHRSDSNSSTD